MADENNYYRNRAKTRLIIIGFVIIIAAGIFFYFLRTNSFQKIESLEATAEKFTAQKLSATFSAPPPLIATSSDLVTAGVSSANKYTLTRAGVVADTNAARAQNGDLPALSENATLDDIAELRLDDMFAKQYFAHFSPSSSSAETVASSVGYDWLALGENLAMGDFVGDQGVVTAWMNSPGHRANILNTQYTQIGVAVGQGDFQGTETWIAVQEFARPASDCPAPDPTLDATITSAQAQASQMQTQIQSDQSQINAMNPQSGSAYDQAVASYNALVTQYDALVAQTKSQVDQYNSEVGAYNQCVGS